VVFTLNSSTPRGLSTPGLPSSFKMLGRLLHTAASSLNPNSYHARHPTPLESVTEEEHTRSLLFPDSSLLQHSQSHTYPLASPPTSASTSTFDDHGGLELDVAKDFRIIIAQDAYGGQDPCVLFDTQSSPSAAATQGLGIDTKVYDTAKGGHSRTPSGNRVIKSPLAVQAGGAAGNNTFPPIPTGTSAGSTRSLQRPLNSAPNSAFCRSKLRSSTLSSIPSDGESYQSRLDMDAREETTALLNCMFGSTIIPYKGPSTKMHILSLEDGSASPSAVTSPVIGRDGDAFPVPEIRKRAILSRANTTSPILGDGKAAWGSDLKSASRGTVLLTRTFAINLPEGSENPDEIRDQEGSASFGKSELSGFPFPETGYSQSGSKPKKMKAKKTPIYAAAIILQLPVANKSVSRPPSRHQSSSFAKPGLSIPSSFDSQKSDWTLLDSPSGIFSPALGTPGTLDDRIDILVDHWDVMTRTLSYLEKVARKEIFDLLVHVDALSPPPQPAKKEGMQKTNQRFVRLPPHALLSVKGIRRETELAAQRISMALRIPRVIAGQDRWGIWREEARWVGRWAGGREQNFFFFNLLTAFLGNHTEWLNTLAPSWYKRRHLLQQKAHQDAEPIITHRTIIVATDKMAARRLIFLLSSFLPATHRIEVVGSPMRPGTSVSKRGYSPSPPTNSLAREESLRRTMNRQRLDLRRNMDHDTPRGHDRSTSLSSIDAPPGETTDKLDSLERISPNQSRRDSDVRSIRTASLPIPANDISTRKSSAAATATVTPLRTTPVPHFASSHIRPTLNNGARTESNDSMASANLLQTLRRSESTNLSTDSNDSHSGSRWGSLLSTIWSSRQDSSTDGSDSTIPSGTRSTKWTTQSPDDVAAPRKSQSKLEEMAIEGASVGQRHDKGESSRQRDTINIPKGLASSIPKTIPESSESHRMPEAPQRLERSPIKLLVDVNDGVVDVDIPLPNFFSSSIDSTIHSSGKDYRQSVASLDGAASLHSHASAALNTQRDGSDDHLNVAGWLQTYHDDFSLQSVLPYPQLENDIKRSMKGEATPAILASTPGTEDGSPNERWTTVCSTLIADTSNFSIKRLRLKRKVKVGFTQPPLPSEGDYQPSSLNESQLGSLLAASTMKQAQSDIVLEEKFVEESLMDLDGTFTDVIERVLARSGQSSKVHSRASSPSGRGRGRHLEHRANDGQSSDAMMGTPSAEVPKAECRRMVLGALEQVVRSVAAEKLKPEGGRLNDSKGEEGLSHSGSTSRSADNSLREGIRKWLDEVQEAA
jgi:hypothetical protein